jgi:hypothetical protein
MVQILLDSRARMTSYVARGGVGGCKFDLSYCLNACVKCIKKLNTQNFILKKIQFIVKILQLGNV